MLNLLERLTQRASKAQSDKKLHSVWIHINLVRNCISIGDDYIPSSEGKLSNNKIKYIPSTSDDGEVYYKYLAAPLNECVFSNESLHSDELLLVYTYEDDGPACEAEFKRRKLVLSLIELIQEKIKKSQADICPSHSDATALTGFEDRLFIKLINVSYQLDTIYNAICDLYRTDINKKLPPMYCRSFF